MPDDERRPSGDGDRPDERQEGAHGGDARPGRVSVWEWVAAAVGVLVAVGTIGFILRQAIAGSDSPPDVVVNVRSVRPVGAGHLVTFEAQNRGGETAAGVVVEGTLAGSEGPVETSETTLDYVPGGSTRQGGLYFGRDPGEYTLTVGAQGYGKP